MSDQQKWQGERDKQLESAVYYRDMRLRIVGPVAVSFGGHPLGTIVSMQAPAILLPESSAPDVPEEAQP